MEEELIDSIKRKEFTIHLQPKVDTKTEKLVGAEALVRKKGKDGLIMPDEFVPSYEESGIITILDLFVLEEVCKLQKKWRENQFPLLPISLNESRMHMKDPKHISKLQYILDKYQANANLIELEMTETSVVEDIKLAKKAAISARNLGFIISMDDFGTGYSSFNILKDIDIDVLKIDKSFFENLEENKKAQIIIETIVDMSQKLNIKTVAEGIETKGQVDFLKEIKCDMIQGYYYSRPLEIQKFEEKLVSL